MATHTEVGNNNHLAIDSVLGSQLSPQASITHERSAAPRWSDYAAPQPGTIVNVATENDVAATVKYCLDNNLNFLAQSGGHGWATTHSIRGNDVLINLRGLNKVTVSNDKNSALLGGGAVVSEITSAAYEADVQIVTGNCNEVGFGGFTLGGGLGRLTGLYGLGIDNLLSVQMVNGLGELVTVTPDDTELWWAIRGAGQNFGIVTSAMVKAYPIARENNVGWVGGLIFTPDKIESLFQAANDLHLTPRMCLFIYYVTSGAPDYSPIIIGAPFYAGPEAEAKQAFASIYAVGPVADQSMELPYNQVNAGGDPFCIKGDRKPCHGVGLAKLEPSAWRAVWEEYTEFLKIPGIKTSGILMEAYCFDKARTFPDSSSSFPFRSGLDYNIVIVPWYEDPELDGVATAFATRTRDILRKSSGLTTDSTYINFARGDEDLAVVYGQNLQRLRDLKKQFDPKNKFNQWFPLS